VKVEFPAGWSPKPVTQASGALSLDATTSGRLAWVVSPEESATRPPGAVEVKATLGELRSHARVTLVPGTARLPFEGVFAFMQYHLALRDMDGALKDVDEALKRQPTHPSLLAWRSDVLVVMGRKEEALQAIDAAIDSAIKLKQKVSALLARRQMIEESK
jgi:hypothetical protein